MRLAPIIAALALAGCQSAMQSPAEMARATAQLEPTQGKKPVGEATFEDTGKGGVHLALIVHGLKAGSEYGVGISEANGCSSTGAMSANGLPAVKADKRGTAKFDGTVNGITVSGVLGRGLLVAEPGEHVACGVIQPG